MPLKIIRNDITKMQVDAIVNTANQVPGFALHAKYIIHAVSPLYIDGESGEEEKLRSCYQKSLMLAGEYNCESIAFPLISTGSFGYPKEEGLRIAVDEISAFLLKHKMDIYLVVFDEESTRLGRRLAPALEAYIDANYVEEKQKKEYARGYREYSRRAERTERMLMPPIVDMCRSMAPSCSNVCKEEEADYSDFFEENQSALKERMNHMEDTFQEYLLYLIETKGLTNAEVYKKALITKQLFSKIKLNREYHPDKATAMRLCVGARLNLDETRDLLARAGYALSPCDKRDIIFTFFIEHDVYDMIEIDIALEEHGLPCFIE